MAEATITKTIDDLRTIFNKMSNVYFTSTAKQEITALSAFDMELPVTEDGVNFDTGSPDISRVKLTNGANWTALAKPGDADISFQVPSVAGVINELLMNKIAAATGDTTATIGGVTYTGQGYSLQPKKVVGALFMVSADKESAIYLPNVEIYSNFVAGENDKPAYFNLAVTPLEDGKGAAIYILNKKAA